VKDRYKFFGEVALEKRFVTAEQLYEALTLQARSKVDIRTRERPDPIATNRFMLSMLVQQIAPNIHHWNRSSLFSVDKLRRHTGWEPEIPFRSAIDKTWRWYRSEGLPEKQDFDFGFEDELIRLVREREE